MTIYYQNALKYTKNIEARVPAGRGLRELLALHAALRARAPRRRVQGRVVVELHLEVRVPAEQALGCFFDEDP